MGPCLSTASRLRSATRTRQITISDSSLTKPPTSATSLVVSPPTAFIHILDDDSLLNIFCLYRPFFLGEDEDALYALRGGRELWGRGNWWYRLAHVCQRWRNLTLGSASYLGLSLVCTNGMPVEDMLAHSPPLPLTIDYFSIFSFTGITGIAAEDEEMMFLALEQRHRIRHLRLVFPAEDLRTIVMTIDGEFPILEYLIMEPSQKDNTPLMLPETLQAPNLHHLALDSFACPIRSRLHPTAAGLVTLYLIIDHQSAYFQPNILLQWISFMPQLESLAVIFSFPVPNHDVERHLTHTPITTPITLPNLHIFCFQGVSAYLEAVVSRITAPRLERLQVHYFQQLTFSVPHLQQFMNTTENLRFDNALILFNDREIDVLMFLGEVNRYAFAVRVGFWHLDWQVSSVVQISNALSQAFSSVEHLTLGHEVHSQSPEEEHNNVSRVKWHDLFRSFNNVKTLRVGGGLVEDVSRCLKLEDGEPPLELLPELQELVYFEGLDTRDAFSSFIHARQNAGCPVTLVRQSLGPSPSQLSIDPPAAIMSLIDEACNDFET